jgi:hypothetical protein
MIQQQQSMMFSKYTDLYDIVVPQDNMLRRINDLIDFSFIFEELKDKYCHDNGRNAIDPIRMFKYLFLKTIRLDLSVLLGWTLAIICLIGFAPRFSPSLPSRPGVSLHSSTCSISIPCFLSIHRTT